MCPSDRARRDEQEELLIAYATSFPDGDMSNLSFVQLLEPIHPRWPSYRSWAPLSLVGRIMFVRCLCAEIWAILCCQSGIGLMGTKTGTKWERKQEQNDYKKSCNRFAPALEASDEAETLHVDRAEPGLQSPTCTIFGQSSIREIQRNHYLELASLPCFVPYSQ